MGYQVRVDLKMNGSESRTVLEGKLQEAAEDLRLGWRFTLQQGTRGVAMGGLVGGAGPPK